ncbi:hypothetical protein L596_030356 [Steinernema carpocapsae]|uniref:Peptidase S1 domain-containing protein n=1 Tax=Steinernema carpocapsae TaxID=34508 RepID=A0A4U5LP58_STECR|nr:hypothetical protein L596_030356 [Steinernema carpocapsae]
MKILVALALFGVTHAIADCGRTPVNPDVSNFIVGGKIAKAYSWPWQVEFCLKDGRGKCHLDCGGTIIDEQWIMTAAHCVDGMTNYPGSIGIKAGTFNYHDNNEPEEQIFDVLEIHEHPNYSQPVTYAHDMSLLKLNKKIKFGKHVQPVCVPKSVKNLVHKGKSAWVTGWGAVYEGGPVSAQLRQVQVPFLDMSVCEKEYPGKIDPVTMECAGRKGVDSCQGDSGGPLVTKHVDNGRWYQAGIVSWGYGCAENRHAGVYSRPSSMCDFIEKTLGKPVCKDT